MKRNFLKIFLHFFLIISLAQSENQLCSYFLKSKCKFGSFFLLDYSECKCKDLKINLTITNSTLNNIKINKEAAYSLNIYFKLKNKHTIIDNEFILLNFETTTITLDPSSHYIFKHVSGFDVNAFHNTYSSYSGATFIFFDSYLAFYSNGRPLKTCHNFPEKPRSLFQAFHQGEEVNYYFNNRKYKPICPLAFSNVDIDVMSFFLFSSTYFGENYLTFLDLEPSQQQINWLNSSIDFLLLRCEKFILTRKTMNPYVFNQTIEILLYGELIGIENGAFKSLKSLKNIRIQFDFYRKLFQRGINWTFDLNSEIRVDLNNSEMISEYFNNNSMVFINELIKDFQLFKGLKKTKIKEIFPDEDFCLYVKFPFEQLVIFYSEHLEKLTRKTCTYAWLTKYYSVFPKNIIQISNDTKFPDFVEKCDFNKR